MHLNLLLLFENSIKNDIFVMLNNIARCVNFHYFVYFYVAVCKYLVTELNIRLAKTADSKAVIETGYSIDKKKVVPYVTSYVLPCSAYNYVFFL